MQTHRNKWIRRAVLGLYRSSFRINSKIGGKRSVINATVIETAFYKPLISKLKMFIFDSLTCLIKVSLTVIWATYKLGFIEFFMQSDVVWNLVDGVNWDKNHGYDNNVDTKSDKKTNKSKKIFAQISVIFWGRKSYVSFCFILLL